MSIEPGFVRKYARTCIKCVIGDDTGTASAVIPQSSFTTVGKTVHLKNCGSLVFNYHIEIRVPNNGLVTESLFTFTEK